MFKVFRDDLVDEMTFRQRPRGSEGWSYMATWRKSLPGRSCQNLFFNHHSIPMLIQLLTFYLSFPLLFCPCHQKTRYVSPDSWSILVYAVCIHTLAPLSLATLGSPSPPLIKPLSLGPNLLTWLIPPPHIGDQTPSTPPCLVC